MKSLLSIILVFSLCVSVLTVSMPELKADSSLVGYWKFDEGGGSLATDSSEYGNTGTLVNSPSWVIGSSGKALSFDGATNYVQVGDSSSLDMTAQVTVEAWVFPRALLDDHNYDSHVVSRCDPDNGWHRYVFGTHRSGKWHYSVGCSVGSALRLSTASVVLNVWTHVAMIYDGSALRLYINGALDSSYPQSGPISTTSWPLGIGCKTTGPEGGPSPAAFFNGMVDEVRIYDRALSQQEIKTDMGANADWPMFRHDLDHTGYSTSKAPETNRTLWTYTTGDYVMSSPAVSDGKVYVGSSDNKTYCLNASTGSLIWSYTTGHWVQSSPAVSDGKVYVGSHDTNVYCLNASTGSLIWNYTTGITGSQIRGSPSISDGKVYVGSYDGKVYCLNASTGAHIWSYTTGYYVFSSPAVADGKVYVGSLDNKTYCLNASTGSFIWSYTTGYDVSSSPAVADGKVYVGSGDNKIYAFGSHDIAVTNVTSSKTVVGQGFSARINVTAANQGGYTETFNVTVCANTTIIQTLTVTNLQPENSTIVTFSWNTTDFVKGNYTISACAWPVEGETETTDNTLTDGWVFVSIPGDVNGDRKVDLKDVFAVGKAFGTTRQGPNPPGRVYVPNCDINDDDKIDLKDYFTTCKNYGKEW